MAVGKGDVPRLPAQRQGAVAAPTTTAATTCAHRNHHHVVVVTVMRAAGTGRPCVEGGGIWLLQLVAMLMNELHTKLLLARYLVFCHLCI